MSSRKLKIESHGIADSIARQTVVLKFNRRLSDLEVAGIVAKVQEAIQ